MASRKKEGDDRPPPRPGRPFREGKRGVREPPPDIMDTVKPPTRPPKKKS